MSGRIGVALSILIAAMGAGAGCRTYSRDINYHPFLAGLAGSQTRAQVVGPRGPYVDPTRVPEGSLVRQVQSDDAKPEYRLRATPGGSVVIEPAPGKRQIISRSASHLIHHIRQTLLDDDVELFTEQVLSEITRQEFIDRGLEPTEAFAWLKKDQQEIERLFSYMPMGEHTPNVVMRPLGGKAYRVLVTGPGTNELKYNAMDMVMEGGNWRLRWFTKD